jgi:hypothetical protein
MCVIAIRMGWLLIGSPVPFAADAKDLTATIRHFESFDEGTMNRGLYYRRCSSCV